MLTSPGTTANPILNHKIFLSVGHDEYWSKPERDNVEAARAAGKHLAFFSGNEVYWKTRWENSVDGTGTPYRTMVCYKEGSLPTVGENACGGKCDPMPEWTGLWRDGCSFPSGNACKPENALTGEISWDGTTGTIQVPDTYKKLRFWRNSAVATLATGQTKTLTPGTLGYEWDWEQYQSSYPAGRITMSNTSFDGHTHKLSFYKTPAGAQVFGAGSVQWSWGLDASHDLNEQGGGGAADPSMQQAMINLFADMGAQPATLQTGLVAATASTDATAPTATFTSPVTGTTVTLGSVVNFTGTAADAGAVGGVEISFDGGSTWSAATGTTAWTYAWTAPASGVYSVKVRGIDDSGNYPTAANATTITITVSTGGSSNCPCTVFGTTIPSVTTDNDNAGGIVVGMKFRATGNGVVTGIRFYKATGNTGTHQGLLYNTSGILLGQATFSGETATGWQQVSFATPVAITGGQTYVAAYYSSAGNYTASNNYFAQATVNGPLSGLADGTDGVNGVYTYASAPNYPANSYQKGNYWVDLVFNNTVTANAGVNQTITLPVSTVTLNGSASTGTISAYAWTLVSGPNVPAITTPTAVSTTVTGLIQGTYIFTLSVNGGASTSQVTITVNPVPPPSANAGANQTITLPTSVVTLNGSGSTGSISSYAWTFVSGPNTPVIATPAAVSTTVNGLIQGTYIFQLSLNGGASTAKDTVTVKPVPPPTANAGSNQTITLPTSSVTLNGSASTGTISVYAWTKISGPNTPVISSPAAVSTAVSGLIQGTYVFQLSVNGGVSTSQVTVTVLPAVVATTIFTTQVPVTATENDGTGVELGVKFTASVAGFVTGIRFYKTSGNAGVHTGELYSSAGVRLAQALFSGETSTGWQQILFASPVAVAANTTYTAAYHSASGNYVSTANYFATALVNGPVTAIADGANGVYSYSSTPVFPSSSYQKSNYWVDVVFTSTPPPPVANAGPNQTITLPVSSVTLSGSASTGSISSYAWTLVSGPNAPVLSTPAAVTTTATGLIQGTYIFQLALNGGTATARDTVKVNPLPPPVANAGSNQVIVLPVSTAVLNGSASSGNITSYNWTLLSGPNVPVTTRLDSVVVKLSSLIQGTYVFQLSLNGGAATAKDTIIVNPVAAPVANAGITQGITLPVASVTLNGSGSTGSISSYAWTFISGPNTPVITSPATVTTTVTSLIAGIYIFQLSLNNGLSTAVDTVIVNPAPPPVANAGTNQTISLPVTTCTLNGSASTGNILSYSWTQISGPDTALIASPNAATTAVSGLVKGTYIFMLSLNEGIDVSQVNVTVNDFITAPIFTTQTPATGTENDGTAVELGVKFRSSQPGTITGIRFYKTVGNSGVHTGELYTSTGVRLAQAIFANETATGWQTVLFSAPVTISAGNTYIAAYHSASGNYVSTGNYFSSAVINAPLTALADGTDGSNGVYAYTSTPSYPSSSYQKSNYWVDPIYSGSGSTADVTPPNVVVTSPAANAADISTAAPIYIFFNEALDPFSVDTNSVVLQRASVKVPASVSYNTADNSIAIVPVGALLPGGSYAVSLRGGAGTGKIKDASGNALVSDSSWSFITGVPKVLANPNSAPGGPILLITSVGNPFSRYTAEILRAEGWNAFNILDITAISAAELSKYDVVVLGEVPLTGASVSLLTDWVTAGGTLIAFRPGVLLQNLLGIARIAAPVANQYLLVNTGTGPGVGIVNQTIQFHDSADVYSVNAGTNVLATIYSDATTATPYPAVTSRNVGTLGGQAIAFTYDLAKSVVYTRQGNPKWVGQKRDGNIPPIRSDDLFFGNASFDPQPDWVDLNKVAIPQADEQQRLLTNIILAGNYDHKPLPKFWFLPKGKKAAVVMTGDDHANGGTAGRFTQYLSLSSSNTAAAVANWDAIRSTSYVYSNSPITNAQIAGFQNQGFEIGLHANTECNVWTPATLQNYFSTQFSDFATRYYVAAPQVSHRLHCMAWSDWATLPKTEVARGIRLNVSYYYWPDVWINNRPGMFTGSGMPMRFADSDGSFVDSYQVPSQMTDESGQIYPSTIDALLSKATGPEGYYGVFCANMHTDNAVSAGSDAIIQSAQNLQIPVVSAKQMLDWLDARNSSTFTNYSWSNNLLGFTVVQDPKALNLKGMLPRVVSAGTFVSLTLNGSPVNTTIDSVKGVSYVFFDATGGNYIANYGPVTTTAVRTLADKILPTADSTSEYVYTLGQNHPNPSYSTTRINYSLPANALVNITLYDMQGRPVKVLVNGMKQAGSYYYDLNTGELAKGMYLYQMKSANFSAVKKLIVQ